MRLLGPLISVFAILSFVVLMLLSAALSLAWPALALVLGLGAASTFHFWIAWAFLRGVPDGLFAAYEALAATGWALLHPLRPRRTILPLQAPLPDLFAFTNDVARQMGQPGVDRVLLELSGNFGVVEVRTRGGVQRVLLAGAALLYVLDEDELRAVLAHEIAHVALGHTRWSRMLGRWREMVEAVASAQRGSFHPVALGHVLSAWLLRRLHAPWARSEELAADRLAARVAGAPSVRAALRRAHEEGVALEVLLEDIADRSEQLGVGPDSLCEAALRAFRAAPAHQQAKLRRAHRGSPFDVDGRSHPPLAARLAALSDLPRGAVGPPRAAIARLPDVRALERRLTERALDVSRRVPARAWAEVRSEDARASATASMAAIGATLGA